MPDSTLSQSGRSRNEGEGVKSQPETQASQSGRPPRGAKRRAKAPGLSQTDRSVYRIYGPDECGSDGYPFAWHRLPNDHPMLDEADLVLPGGIKDCVRALAGHRCERCQHPFRVGIGHRILTVHHLNGVKADLRWWNLAALCQRCHLQIQGRVQMERVWPWAHSDWFKLHAAGWYAFAYLDEDITREDAIQRLDELLALERVA